ncbi:acyltransferase [Paenibacillus tyrfis]|uniref:acyltransferase n=1 Tax=Paenibacillus tyrfis TaxID=1501230 RepID=UPI00209CDFCC|nr:acyltransferase [Paenibacillus tyrfis]MCP1309714.1 acetyltransferase [Paenibacillus tyrfis]
MKNIFIHPTANVSSEAVIGPGTKIWVNSQIREGTEIGENCIISKDTYIDQGVKIGHRVKIQNGVSIYNGVTVEDDVFIGPNAVFTNDFYPRAFNENWAITKTTIKRGVSIGANATIVCGTELGEYCMVGAGSVVTKNVPRHALVIGNPARIVGFVCKCGNKLSNNKCLECDSELSDF